MTIFFFKTNPYFSLFSMKKSAVKPYKYWLDQVI